MRQYLLHFFKEYTVPTTDGVLQRSDKTVVRLFPDKCRHKRYEKVAHLSYSGCWVKNLFKVQFVIFSFWKVNKENHCHV